MGSLILDRGWLRFVADGEFTEPPGVCLDLTGRLAGTGLLIGVVGGSFDGAPPSAGGQIGDEIWISSNLEQIGEMLLQTGPEHLRCLSDRRIHDF